MADSTAVTVIGLGDMGAALAHAFLDAGHTTTVWNRTAAKADALVAKGAVRASSPAAAVQASPVVIVCLLDYDSVHEVLAPLGDALAGRTIYNLTNGTPRQGRDTAAWAAERGYDYLDGGIMAVPPSIATEHAFILYSGANKAAFDRDKKLLGVLGDPRFCGADPGLASLFDLAVNGAMYSMVGGALQAITVVGTEDEVDVPKFTEELLIPYLRALMASLPNLAEQITTGQYSLNAAATLGMQQVGFRNIRRASSDQGISTELLDPIQSLIDRRVADGFAEDDFAGVHELLKRPRK